MKILEVLLMTDDILDEFEEFMSVNTEYVREEDNVEC